MGQLDAEHKVCMQVLWHLLLKARASKLGRWATSGSLEPLMYPRTSQLVSPPHSQMFIIMALAPPLARGIILEA